MIEFGFGISPSSRINLDDFDKEKWNKLVQIEPEILQCISCGSCCASCSGGVFQNVSLKSAILNIRNGKTDSAMELLKGCMLCGKCTMVCPRNINTRNLILSIYKTYSEK